MKISYNKLKSYMPALPEVNALVEQVIFHAFEVEEIEKQGDDSMLDIKVLPDRAFDAKTEEGMVKEISVITGAHCDKEKIEQALLKLGGEKHEIKISTEEVKKKLGVSISSDAIGKIFERFWYPFIKEGDVFTVTIPSYRPDLIGTHDLIDEIIRIHGYENLPGEMPKIGFKPKTNEAFLKIMSAREKLLTEGYSEVMTYTFATKGEVEVLASASDKKFLRANLTDGLKDSSALNSGMLPLLGISKFSQLKIFEIGTVFKKTGEQINVAYCEGYKITENSLDEFCKDLNINSNLLKAKSYKPEAKFTPWSLFPFIARDIAVWVPSEVESEKVRKVIKENASELLVKGPDLFDEFAKEGRKSYAYRLVFQSYDKTLTDNEINDIMKGISDKISANSGWQIR